jgi:GNAT superfamily N-acetyltransferase
VLTPQPARIVQLDDEIEVWTGTATEETIEIIGRMFAAQGERRSPELLRWQYLEHLGGAHVCIAHTKAGLSAEPVALYAAFPTRFQLRGREVVAYQSFDTLTSLAFRGRGLFVRLAEVAYRQIAEAGASLVYGIPNGESFGGFVRRLGWSVLDPLPMLIRPIGLRYLRARLGIRRPITHASASTVAITNLPSDVSDLFRRSQYAGTSGVIRDAKYLMWRVRRPDSTYRCIESRTMDGQLIGLALVEIAVKHGGTIGYLMEFMVDPMYTEQADQLLGRAVEVAAVAGADVVLAWSMPDDPTHKVLRHRGFRSLSPRISPIELHLGYRAFHEGISVSRDDLRWSYLDSDTV